MFAGKKDRSCNSHPKLHTPRVTPKQHTPNFTFHIRHFAPQTPHFTQHSSRPHWHSRLHTLTATALFINHSLCYLIFSALVPFCLCPIFSQTSPFITPCPVPTKKISLGCAPARPVRACFAWKFCSDLVQEDCTQATQGRCKILSTLHILFPTALTPRFLLALYPKKHEVSFSSYSMSSHRWNKFASCLPPPSVTTCLPHHGLCHPFPSLHFSLYSAHSTPHTPHITYWT